jgi:hypothetical protein
LIEVIQARVGSSLYQHSSTPDAEPHPRIIEQPGAPRRHYCGSETQHQTLSVKDSGLANSKSATGKKNLRFSGAFCMLPTVIFCEVNLF